MRSVWAVYKRELGYYFHSPTAYGITFIVILFLGLFFSSTLTEMVRFNVSQSSFTSSTLIADAHELLRVILELLALLTVFAAPALAMRLLAQESREGTLEILMTLPISDWAFVVGKYLAVWTFYTLLLSITLLQIPILNTLGLLDIRIVFISYLGSWLYGGTTLALSMLWSAITEEQIVAFFLSLGTLLILYLADTAAIWAAGQTSGDGIAGFIRELGLTAHYQDTMLEGLLRVQDVLYFGFVIALMLFATTLLIGSRRWRGTR